MKICGNDKKEVPLQQNKIRRLSTMGKIKKKLKKIRIHHEGTNTLLYGGIALVLIALILWFAVPTKIPFWIFAVVFGTVYG